MFVSSGFANSPAGARMNPKHVVVAGLLLLAAGSSYIVWTAHASSGRWDFLPGLVLSGLGMGFIWTPVYSLATRDLRPELGGVASGVLNTIQELGAVMASASVGAVLQNRLATALRDHAAGAAGQLPPDVRDGFVRGLGSAARGGLEVGAGQTGGSVPLPPGVPAQIAQQVQQLAHAVFAQAFVDAMRPALLLPIAVILAAALVALAARGRERQAAEHAPAPEHAPV